MTLLEFTSSCIASLAWPVTAGVIVWLLRDSIKRLLLTVTSLKYKDLQVDFGRELKELEQKAAVLDIKPASRAAAPAHVQKDPDEFLANAERLMDEFPEPAIALAWSAVEAALEGAVQRLAVSPGDPARRAAADNAHRLAEQNLIDRNTLDVLDRLRALRNAAVHGRSAIQVSALDAQQYVSIARAAVDRLRTPSH
jgi:hypothetical protein